jgi:hypothetical protein
MAHPFSSPNYPWQLPLAQKLHDVLSNRFPDNPASLLIAKAGINRPDIAWSPKMRETWQSILETAAAQQKLDALFAQILQDNFAQDARAVVLEVQAMAVEATAAGSDPCRELLLPGDEPFLDRENLRSVLGRMRGTTSRPILLVRGTARSGKSRTLEIVKLVAAQKGDGILYFDEGSAIGLDSIAKRILSRINGKPTDGPARVTTDAAWYAQVATDALNLAKQAGKRWWLIMDDLAPDAQGQPRVDPEILELFHQFALQMGDPEFREQFRLVLIDYPNTPQHPPSKLRKTLIEQDATAPFSDSHVSDFLRAVLTRRQAKFAESDLANRVTHLLTAATQKHAAEPDTGLAAALNSVLVSWMGEPWQS